jgi:hypothetical protein
VLRECSGGKVREVLEDVEDILRRAGDEEVLLQQAKLLADFRFVVWIEHLGDRLGGDFILDRLPIVAGAEDVELERLDGSGAPQSQGVARVHAVALNRGVVGEPLEYPPRRPARAVVAGFVDVVFALAVPVDVIAEVGVGISHGFGLTNQLSGFSTCQPSWISWSKMPNS